MSKQVGLEYRIKGAERFKEKVAEHSAANFRVSAQEIADRMPNALRYTYLLPFKSYASSYADMREHVTGLGYNLLFVKNMWNDPYFKGIVTRWRSHGGQRFEVQFHTAASFENRLQTHDVYTKVRSSLTEGHEVARMWACLAGATSEAMRTRLEEKVIYYAIVGHGGSAVAPSGLVRRRQSPEIGIVDEALHKDFEWYRSGIIATWMHGSFSEKLEVVTEARAQRIVTALRAEFGRAPG